MKLTYFERDANGIPQVQTVITGNTKAEPSRALINYINRLDGRPERKRKSA